MSEKQEHHEPAAIGQKPSRMPEESLFFEKFIPAALVVLGLSMAALILFAIGILLGLIQF